MFYVIVFLYMDIRGKVSSSFPVFFRYTFILS